MGTTRQDPSSFPIGPHEQEDSAVRTRSKRARAAKQAQTQFDTVKGRLKPTVESAASGARDRGVLVAERVGPAVGAARDRVAPTVRAARDNVGPAAESAYETAKDKVGPVVADARDRVVDDLLPRLAEAIAAASAAAIAARDSAVDSAQETATAAVNNLPANRRKRRRRRLVFVTMAIAGIGAGVAAAKARSKQDDPWTPGAPAGPVNGTTRLTPTPAPIPNTTTTPTPAPVDEALAGTDPVVDPLSDAEDSSTPADER
jgi:hypothetical protein